MNLSGSEIAAAGLEWDRWNPAVISDCTSLQVVPVTEPGRICHYWGRFVVWLSFRSGRGRAGPGQRQIFRAEL